MSLSDRCGTCGTPGLRTEAWLCAKCGEAFHPAGDAQIGLHELKAPTESELPCEVCGKTQGVVELLSCAGCSTPTRTLSPSIVGHTGAPQPAVDSSIPITVDPEIETLLPPLQPEELAGLAATLSTEGCRDPLVVWRDRQRHVLLDGHHRLKICDRLGISYKVEIIDLPDREAAIDWVVRHQLSRRNLTDEQRAYFRGKLYARMKRRGRPGASMGPKSGQNVRFSTAGDLGAVDGVTEKTIRRNAEYARHLDELAGTHGPEIRQGILSGALKLAQKDLPTLLKQDKATQERLIAGMRKGEPMSRLLADRAPDERARAGHRTEPAATAGAPEMTGEDIEAAGQPIAGTADLIVTVTENNVTDLIGDLERFFLDREEGTIEQELILQLEASMIELCNAFDHHLEFAGRPSLFYWEGDGQE